MNNNIEQQQPDVQSVIWILWFALLTTIFTFSFVIFNLKSDLVKNVDEESLLSIFAGIAIIFAFLSKVFHQRANAIINKKILEAEDKKIQTSKSLTPYLLSWALGTEVIAILGLVLRFYGGASFTQYSYGFLGAAFLLHIVNRPSFSFKS